MITGIDWAVSTNDHVDLDRSTIYHPSQAIESNHDLA